MVGVETLIEGLALAPKLPLAVADAHLDDHAIIADGLHPKPASLG
jgi:hypothetical protein